MIYNNIKNIAETDYNISVQINKSDDNIPLPNIPNASTSKIQKKFLKRIRILK